MPETTKKAVVSVPARVKFRPKSAISQGNSDGMTRWKKCEVAWAKPTIDITRTSPARVATEVDADASIVGATLTRARQPANSAHRLTELSRTRQAALPVAPF